MRRIGLPLLATLLTACALLPGCSTQNADSPDVAVAPVKKETKEKKNVRPAPKETTKPKVEPAVLKFQERELTDDEKYDAALADGLRLLSDRKYNEALTALEAAQAFKPSDTLKIEIAKLRTRIDQQTAADKTIEDIQQVLAQGDPARAAELIAAALQQYGGTDAAPKLTQLKLQADALAGATLKTDDEKFARFKAEAAAAATEKNLRAEALALEQALQFGKDAQLKERLDAARDALQTYDDKRQQAAELRKDNARLEDALTLLQDASKAWETPQVRQEIDEVTLALENRRDRLAVADFEVRGEVGIPAAGREIADNLLPLFKKRFDLVERGQLAKVVEELKLEAGQVSDDAAQQKEIGRLTKARYLLLGSVSPLGGVTINARLVDVQTGLVVQSGKVTAATPQEALNALPELADLLLMTDEERIAAELKRAEQPKEDPNPPVPDNAKLPPPPPLLAPPPGQQPPPILINVNQAPPLAGFQAKDFQLLAPPPSPNQPQPMFVPGGQPELLVQRRLLVIALQMGDNLFLRGRYLEALRHYQFALSLDPTNFDVRLRLDRLMPLLPPPPVVVFDPPPPRPRVAFLPFVVAGNPNVVPPGLSLWTPWHLAPYFSPQFEVVDRDELFWYMGRAGISVRDLITNPYARRWLGRALNVQFFVLGDLRETASFDVVTYLVDAEYGFLRGTGRINVRTPYELKLRLYELARLTLMSPEQRLVYLNQQQQYNALLAQAQQQRQGGNFRVAIDIYRDALKLRPGSVEVNIFIERDDRLARQATWKEARRREYERQQLEAVTFQQRQLDLSRQAEAARLQAERDRVVLEQQRLPTQDLAYQQLLDQARRALTVKNFQMSVQSFEGALNLRRDDGVYRELAEARLAGQRAAEQRADVERALRLEAERKARDAQLVAARAQLDLERQKRLDEEKARFGQQKKANDLAYQRNFDEGQRLLNLQKYDAAIAALQAARQVRKTDAVEALLTQAFVGQTKAKDQGAFEKLQKQLALEKTRREAAETEAKAKQRRYDDLLKTAQVALTAKKFEQAIGSYKEAGKLYQTDVVLTGLRQAESARDQAAAQAKAAQQAALQKEQQGARFKQLLGEGQAALAAKDFDKALTAFGQAKTLQPDNLEALTGLTKAQQLRSQAVADAKLKIDAQEKQKQFQRLLEAAQGHFANKRYDAAMHSATDALRWHPGDAVALKLRDDAAKAQKLSVEPVKTAETKKLETFNALIKQGQSALAAKKNGEALKLFQDAKALLPNNPTVAPLLAQAQKAVNDDRIAQDLTQKQKAAEAKKLNDFNAHVNQGKTAMSAKKYADAVTHFSAAKQLFPDNPTVAPLLAQAQKAANDDRSAQDLAQKKAAEAKKLADFTGLMNQGKAALGAKKYQDAANSFGAALKLYPNSTPAQQGLRDAQQGLAGQPNPQVVAAFNKKMQDALALEKQQKWSDAIKAYQDALKIIPTDAVAKERIRVVGYTQHLQEGQRHLAARRFTEAQREFEAALALDPNSTAAQSGLQKAKNKMQ